MKSQWVCRATPECNGLINKDRVCGKCGKVCQEELTTGEIVLRKDIPDYILKDIDKITEENTRLMNNFVVDNENLVLLQRGITANFDRRVELQKKMKATVEGAIRKAKLHKDTEVRWGFDAYQRTFFGLKKPKSKVIEEKGDRV